MTGRAGAEVIAHIDTGMYTAREVATRWGIGLRTLYDLVDRDEAPVKPVKIGRSLRWPKHLVEAVVAGEVAS